MILRFQSNHGQTFLYAKGDAGVRLVGLPDYNFAVVIL